MRKFNATRLLRYEARARMYLSTARALAVCCYQDPITREVTAKIIAELNTKGEKWQEKAREYEPR